jgi:hypothetical protein
MTVVSQRRQNQGQTYHSCMTDDRKEYIAIMLVVFGLYSYCLRAGAIQ